MTACPAHGGALLPSALRAATSLPGGRQGRYSAIRLTLQNRERARSLSSDAKVACQDLLNLASPVQGEVAGEERA